jgi:hypothetical protein
MRIRNSVWKKMNSHEKLWMIRAAIEMNKVRGMK